MYVYKHIICIYTLPRKLPQVAIGFQRGRNVIHHTMPTIFNESHNYYTGNSTVQNSNNLTIPGTVLIRIVATATITFSLAGVRLLIKGGFY